MYVRFPAGDLFCGTSTTTTSTSSTITTSTTSREKERDEPHRIEVHRVPLRPTLGPHSVHRNPARLTEAHTRSTLGPPRPEIGVPKTRSKKGNFGDHFC